MQKLPDKFLFSLQNILSPQELDLFLGSFQVNPPTSIRFNPHKKIRYASPTKSVAWASQGVYLEQRPSFTEDPLFWAGAYYVQEASSMFLEQVVKKILGEKKNIKVLDLSAAPGGKSTHLLSLLPESSLLVANEIIKSRADILEENLNRWGNGNYLVTQSDAQVLGRLSGFFDIILVDAPCSGEGMFRKDPKSIEEWSEESVNLCSIRQKRILSDILPALSPNGYLIYSTCTYNTQENEENLSWLRAQEDLTSIKITTDSSWGVREVSENQLYAYRFFPHLLEGEGFFMACFQKKLWGNPKEIKTQKNIFTKISKKQKEILEQWLDLPNSYDFYSFKERIFALRENFIPWINTIALQAYIKHTALYLGSFKQNDFIPSQALAHSTWVSERIPRWELSYEQAMQYLRKQNFSAENISEKGWHLVTYQSLGLGWAKILPNRINNYYPTEWRVRK
ncbi:MAG: RNA methyltransferase [Cytophagales bacterium]|nr:RNA methyltransferase [Cytophagales bacterium]